MPFLLSLVTIAYLGSMLAGSAAAILKPDVLHSFDAILPMMLLEYAPGWIMAIIMCCGAAACLSTANSGIHSISSLLALDVYKKYINPTATEYNIVLIAKVSIVAFSTITYLVLAFYKTPGLIVNTGFIALSGLSQLIVPVLGALLWHKSNSTGAIWGLLAGVLFTLIFSFHYISSLPISPGVIAIFINVSIFILCGLLLPGDKITEKKIYAYRRNHFEEEQI